MHALTLINETVFKAKRPVNDGFVKVVSWYGNDSFIDQMVRVDTDKPRTSSQITRLINYMIQHKHTSPFEHPHITLHVRMPLALIGQMDKHRTAKYTHKNQKSARYEEFPRTPIHVQWKMKALSGNRQGSGKPASKDTCIMADDILAQTQTGYERLKALGISPEQARFAMVQGTSSEFMMTLSADTLMHMLGLRLANEAQRELQAFMLVIADIFNEWLPITYKAWEKRQNEEEEFTLGDLFQLSMIVAKFDTVPDRLKDLIADMYIRKRQAIDDDID